MKISWKSAENQLKITNQWPSNAWLSIYLVLKECSALHCLNWKSAACYCFSIEPSGYILSITWADCFLSTPGNTNLLRFRRSLNFSANRMAPLSIPSPGFFNPPVFNDFQNIWHSNPLCQIFFYLNSGFYSVKFLFLGQISLTWNMELWRATLSSNFSPIEALIWSGNSVQFSISILTISQIDYNYRDRAGYRSVIQRYSTKTWESIFFRTQCN